MPLDKRIETVYNFCIWHLTSYWLHGVTNYAVLKKRINCGTSPVEQHALRVSFYGTLWSKT